VAVLLQANHDHVIEMKKKSMSIFNCLLNNPSKLVCLARLAIQFQTILTVIKEVSEH
jgi:hypothetical protein